MSDDMRRELKRQEWERQELETMEEEKSGPIHYSDVRHNGNIFSHFVYIHSFVYNTVIKFWFLLFVSIK